MERGGTRRNSTLGAMRVQHASSRGFRGHAPQEIFEVICSEIDSDAFWDIFPRQVTHTNLYLTLRVPWVSKLDTKFLPLKC